MSRRFGWALLLAVGIVLGWSLGGYQCSVAAPAADDAAAEEQAKDVAEQLRSIRTQVKEINALLQSGKLMVVVAINPDAPR
jgi:hypothetical protein